VSSEWERRYAAYRSALHEHAALCDARTKAARELDRMVLASAARRRAAYDAWKELAAPDDINDNPRPIALF
jgi:hypothetical protein